MPREMSLLISDLGSSDVDVRRSAAEEFARRGIAAGAAAVPLARAAADESEAVREHAVAALEELGPPAAADLPALASLLGDQQADTSYWAATLLGRLESAAAPAVPSLCAALKDDRPQIVRERAAWALGEIGPAAGDRAVAALRPLVENSPPRLSRLAERAIGRISR